MMENETVPSKRSIHVTVQYKPNDPPVYITEWSSNGIPIKDNKLVVSVNPEVDGKYKLDCRDKLTDVKYVGEQFIPKYEKYMVLVVEDDKATLRPCAYFRMKPQLDLPVRTSGTVSSLSFTEQMDEINEKFGSKKTIRRIEERKKNAIAYGTEDYQDMKEKAKELVPNPIAGTDVNDKKADESTNYRDPFLMPPRNDSAISVSNVYNIYDIMPQSLVESIKVFYDFTDLRPSIASPLVQHFATKAKDDSEKASCVFLDALIKFKGLKPTEIARVETFGIDNVKCPDLVTTIVQNYSISTLRLGKIRRTLDEKCKDKVILHSIILSIILNAYRPLLISALAQAFQTSVIRIKKFGNIVGCHVEMNPTKTERLLTLRIPLFTMEDISKFKRRKVR